MDMLEEFADMAEAPPATPAATLVIFRRKPDGGSAELLMVQRSAEMRFAGGAAVFPGGRVDPADFLLAEALGAADPETRDEWAARIAAVRETIEETGLVIGMHQRATLAQAHTARAMLLEQAALAPVLAAMGWTLDLDGLVPFSRWRPKHKHMRIYDTRFYLADLGTGAVDLLVDETENTHLFWVSAAEALRMADAGEIQVIFPTRRNLERLAQFADFAGALTHVEAFPSQMITPAIIERDGTRWLTIPEKIGYPITEEALDSVSRG
jgi:8-oxo-dGTP pyrophosphatase MutT (NUDIX family)